MRGENEYIPIFLPWFITQEYRRPAPEGFEKTLEEEELVEKYELDDDQLYWRRLKIAESGENKFKQEYPATPEEAFRVSGNSVFDQECIEQYEVQAPNYIRQYDEGSSYFEDSREGHLEVWTPPIFEVTASFVILPNIVRCSYFILLDTLLIKYTITRNPKGFFWCSWILLFKLILTTFGYFKSSPV